VHVKLHRVSKVSVLVVIAQCFTGYFVIVPNSEEEIVRCHVLMCFCGVDAVNAANMSIAEKCQCGSWLLF
jgi:hypothetical protein